MNNHVYKFADKLKVQEGNGSMGDEVIGVIAQFVMLWWERKFRAKLEELNLKNKLLERYIDDINTVFEETQPGIVYEDGMLVFKPEKVEEDKSKPSDIVTMELMTMIADNVDDML